MKPKTARRILKKRAWEIAERNINGSPKYKKWLGRLEAKCIKTLEKDVDDQLSQAARHFAEIKKRREP